jgi:hypothetical protein
VGAVSDTLDLGVTGIDAALGDHICGLYSNELQRRVQRIAYRTV